jgi:flagellar biogenesis protein FliO
MTDLYLQLILALALVIGVIFLVGAVLRKNQYRDGLMKVMGYQSLGPKKGVAAVKVGKDILILGVTPTDLKLFKTLTDAEAERLSAPGVEKEMAIAGKSSDKLSRLRALKDALR